MRAGRLRHVLELQAVTEADPVGDGTRNESLATFATTRGEVTPADPSDVERRFANQVQAPITSLVRLRHRPNVTTSTVVKFGTRLLYVRGIQNVGERNRELVLACEEKQG